MAAGYLAPGPGSAGNPVEIRATLSRLLASVVDSLPAEEAQRLAEDYFEKAHRSFPSLAEQPDGTLRSCFARRASSAIISLLGWEMQFLRDLGPHLAGSSVSVLGGRPRKPGPRYGCLPCVFRMNVMRQRHCPGDGFEGAARAASAGSRGPAVILGFDRLRYREAVDLLMEAGEIEKAELYCRIQRDFVPWQGRGGKTKGTSPRGSTLPRGARPDGALRCAKASADGRLVARVHEWRGEPGEALGLLKNFGRPSRCRAAAEALPLLRRVGDQLPVRGSLTHAGPVLQSESLSLLRAFQLACSVLPPPPAPPLPRKAFWVSRITRDILSFSSRVKHLVDMDGYDFIHSTYKRTVSEKGQITIPKAIRDDWGLQPGTVL